MKDLMEVLSFMQMMQLDERFTQKRVQLEQRKTRTPMAAIIALAEMQERPLPILNMVTERHEICILGSISRTEIYDPVGSALKYQRLGADGLTLYTDDDLDADGLEDLLLVKRAVKIPVISYDYILDGYHVAEARAAGASALTAYASLLDDLSVRRIVSLIQRWRMTAILQIDREAHIQHLRTTSPHVTAVGTPDIEDAAHDLQLLLQLRPSIPYNIHCMPLHPLTTLDQVMQALELGVDAFTCAPSLLKDVSIMEQIRSAISYSRAK
jgi:indole-3-glycerol phosphate synthase